MACLKRLTIMSALFLSDSISTWILAATFADVWEETYLNWNGSTSHHAPCSAQLVQNNRICQLLNPLQEGKSGS